MRVISITPLKLLLPFFPLLVTGFTKPTSPCTIVRSSTTRSPVSLSISKEEDLELTRKIIIDHIDAIDSDSEAIEDDDDDGDEGDNDAIDDTIKDTTYAPPKEQEDLEAEAGEGAAAGYGLASGTTNTYVIPGMEEMGAEEYRDKLQETISARQAQRRKQAIESGVIGNRSSSGYLDKLNSGRGDTDPLGRAKGDDTTTTTNRPPKWQPSGKKEEEKKA
eukprot:CAMPEP_0196135282 /NCGR_PEP_ID=MMETSP0910-20130528/3978_1 /TAXON_ID=49265 /ORGANISM="Thalassiosira rotula, Strain GSO102" /LENGTH=218 /DNA_ID=CAMNT_0041395401 /DNA_START=39 /DNA_END=695 /DNA_ORIENTATION=-